MAAESNYLNTQWTETPQDEPGDRIPTKILRNIPEKYFDLGKKFHIKYEDKQLKYRQGLGSVLFIVLS